jgi:3'-phosphoadenosine 5'-phosphosulfate sulfotransferase (PAPS reductase)/FAD synthetase
MSKVRHVLGISGGKDSAALAIYMHQKYPEFDIEYYTCDTGKELSETYKLIDNLEVYLGKKIIRLKAFDKSTEAPFDHKLKTLGGFLPSPLNRWCTKTLKLDLFEKFIGTDPVISYVGIRGDEEREGYISNKSNIQSIFPFRRNIWSEDVLRKAMANASLPVLIAAFEALPEKGISERFRAILETPLSPGMDMNGKVNKLLNLDVIVFNTVINAFIKTTDYPLSREENFPLLTNEDNLIRQDIFDILEDSNVGVPEYYKAIEFEIDGIKGSYSRSRSGCFFCFYQQKIEWIWLYEQHPNLFAQAMEYEKEGGHTWNDGESLADLIEPERIRQIKLEYLKKVSRTKTNSPFLLDLLDDAEEEGCASCFI